MTVEKIKKIWLADGIHLVRDMGPYGTTGYWISFTSNDSLGTVALAPGGNIAAKAMKEVCERLFTRAEMEAREQARQQPLFGENLED